MVPAILPTLAGAAWGLVDLDAEARASLPAEGDNPLLDPDGCERFVAAVARRLGVDHTWGGYLEDRSRLWAGHYHAPGAMRHLGLDLNAPAGTPATAAADCTVTRVVRDPDGNGGWGGLVFMRLDTPHLGARHLLYGHLAHAGLPGPGARLRAGDPVGTLGLPSENGGWFPHLHVQCFDDALHARFAPRLESMDGYGPNGTGPLPAMPDPTGLVMRPGPGPAGP